MPWQKPLSELESLTSSSDCFFQGGESLNFEYGSTTYCLAKSNWTYSWELILKHQKRQQGFFPSTSCPALSPLQCPVLAGVGGWAFVPCPDSLAIPLSQSGSEFYLICFVKKLGSCVGISPVQRTSVHISKEKAKNDVKLGTSPLRPSWVWGIRASPNSVIGLLDRMIEYSPQQNTRVTLSLKT